MRVSRNCFLVVRLFRGHTFLSQCFGQQCCLYLLERHVITLPMNPLGQGPQSAIQDAASVSLNLTWRRPQWLSDKGRNPALCSIRTLRSKVFAPIEIHLRAL